jgi:hypothetical protein
VPIGALVAPGEVFVSGMVEDLVLGSGIEFSERGEDELKGSPIPGPSSPCATELRSADRSQRKEWTHPAHLSPNAEQPEV